MKKFEHDIKLLIQSPEAVCGPTTFSMQLAHLGKQLSPIEVVNQATALRRSTDWGFNSAELACLGLKMGLQAKFYAFDGRTLDYSWSGLNQENLKLKLQNLCEFLLSEMPVNESKLRYALSYLKMMEMGGELYIKPFVTKDLILELLLSAPVSAGVAFNVFASEGKRNSDETFDPHSGGFGTHSVLIYGYSEETGFMIADPAPGRGKVNVSTENLTAAIMAAQFEDDNVIFQVLN